MNKKLIISIVFVCSFFGGIAQETVDTFGVGHGKKIFVNLYVDNKMVKMGSRFEFFFINGSDTFLCKKSGTTIIPSEVKKDTGYRVVFRYKNMSLSFDRISRRMIDADQDITWVFGVDNYPFISHAEVISDDQYKDAAKKKTQRIEYLRLQLMEYGDGRQFVKMIE
jgi:hypothetical protein